MKKLFSDRDILHISLPLFLEQGLVMLVGMVDIAVVSYVGDAAVSGVSLINQFNIIFVYLFISLATGGAVVVSQYIGRENFEQAGRSASQLLTISLLAGLAVSTLVYVFNQEILHLIFGEVADDVFAACSEYIRVSALGYPFLAAYNAGAVIFRSMGRTSTTMYVSALSNIINIIGNFIGVFILNLGVTGVAYPSVIALAFSALWLNAICFRGLGGVKYSISHILCIDIAMVMSILRIAIPNSLESAVAQVVKVALTGMIALFGTAQIAAYGVAQSIWSVAALVGVAMRPVFITVIGQCMGAQKIDQAAYYFRHLMQMTVGASIAWNTGILILVPLVLNIYQLSDEIKDMVFYLVLLHNVFNGIAFPFSCTLGSGLRATGDVKYIMIAVMASTIFVRLVLSYVLGMVCDFGVFGIAIAMTLDWVVCGILFYRRQKSGQWKYCHVID